MTPALRRRFVSSLTFVALVLASVQLLPAAPRLAPVFGDHMVVQREQRVPVWGTADAGERITVQFKSQEVSTTADASGAWRVDLAPLRADALPAEFIVRGSTTLTLRDVLVGEVWLASGQSNMAWTVARSEDAAKTIAAGNRPSIRELQVARTPSLTPQAGVAATWKVCSPETVPDFSAVAHYFARDLQSVLGIPIGIIHASWGGTPAEAWTSQAALLGEPRMGDLLKRWEETLALYPKRLPQHELDRAAWTKARDAAREAGTPYTKRAPEPPPGPLHHRAPANLYNGMIHPLIPVAVRGVIWYQGEGNAGWPEEYATLFPLMIRDWRARWGAGELPFLFVQLAAFKHAGTANGGLWPWLREAQTRTLALPATGQAITIDIGDPDDIHPTNKHDVGNRLARIALKRVYRVATVDSGPVFKRLRVRGKQVRLEFDHVQGGLSTGGRALEGFALAGADRVFHRAAARIEGARVVVESDAVARPVAVRYAWDNSPVATLANTDGLPAVPFRTDDWPRDGAQ